MENVIEKDFIIYLKITLMIARLQSERVLEEVECVFMD